MAVLSAAERIKVAAHWMRRNTDDTSFTRAQLQAAVDATDTWIDSNTASWTAALPAQFRNNSTAAQKTWLFLWVVMRRAGFLQIEGD